MTGAGTSQQSTPENQTSSPPTAASNNSNASNAEGSTVAIGAHTFCTDFTHERWRHGGGTSLGNSHMSSGIHSNAPPSQDQDQSHTHAASSSDNDARNDTAGELPQSLTSTAQHLPDIEASTRRSMTTAGHDDGFVRLETSDSVLPDFIDTSASSLSQRRVNSRGPSSNTPHADTAFDGAGSDHEDSDGALVERAMRETFEIITRASLPVARKRDLLFKIADIFQRRGRGYPEIAALVESVSLSIKKSSPRNLRKKFVSIVKKLDNIKERLAQLIGPAEVPATANEGGKRKALSEFDTDEDGQPSNKKSRLSGATTTQEKETARASDTQKFEKLSQTCAEQTVIVDDDLGHASDEVRYSMSFCKDALVVSTDGSFGISPLSHHAGGGAAWQAPERDNEDSNSVEMDWYGISWPLRKVIDGEPGSSAYAERMAIRLALHTIVWGNMLEGRQKLVIQTDSRSCLRQIANALPAVEALDSNINDIVVYIDALVSSNVDVKFIWVKGHHLCIGNLIADKFAHGGQISSGLGRPPITSMEDDAALHAQVQKYAAGLPETICKKVTSKRVTCDAGTQTEPTPDGNQVSPPESFQQNPVAPNNATHVQQTSPDSDTPNDDLTASTGQISMDKTTIADGRQPDVGSSENGNARAAIADSEHLDAVQQSDRVNHTGTTGPLARFNLAYEEPFMRDELRAAVYEGSGARMSPVYEEGEAWNFYD